MAKNPTTEVLKRWMEMERALRGDGLYIPWFAKKWGVTQKTVRRDLEAFKALGQKVRPFRDYDDNGREIRQFDVTAGDPLFVETLRELGLL
jgi:hypothetical protein